MTGIREEMEQAKMLSKELHISDIVSPTGEREDGIQWVDLVMAGKHRCWHICSLRPGHTEK
jgi:hypothetical protein